MLNQPVCTRWVAHSLLAREALSKHQRFTNDDTPDHTIVWDTSCHVTKVVRVLVFRGEGRSESAYLLPHKII